MGQISVSVGSEAKASAGAAGDAHTLRHAFLESMASNSTSVSVVTTSDGERPVGVTISACTSVSADPPTLLVCINRRSPAHAAVSANGVFAVNLLNVAQRGIADTFAGRSNSNKPFDFSCCTVTHGTHCAPLIDEAVASLECVLIAQQDIGTHTVFFGEVKGIRLGAPSPLLYCRRDYGRFEAFKESV
ncbi:flavin reductase family protein [Paraburkholderia sp.]|uniref:flavin reductase family protein n=1 Tax=Paraburkholderia sp. TaxID=1926495 RepID=UPI00239ACA27|nr:flavin reductase family protein [Paraburkholderia sp.]MDE1181822.1 flavin reductase family protein [Paraburkholderia sp.]